VYFRQIPVSRPDRLSSINRRLHPDTHTERQVMKKNNRHHRTHAAMSREEICRQLENLRRSATRSFQEDGYLNPSFALFRSGEEPVILSNGRFASRVERARQWQQLERLLDREDVGIVHLAEAWYIESTDTPSAPLWAARPSEHPDRQEGLVIAAKWRGGIFSWRAKIRRVNGQPIVAEWLKMSAMDGMFVYPDQPMGEGRVNDREVEPEMPRSFEDFVEYATERLRKEPEIINQLWIEECCQRAGLSDDQWNRMSEAQRQAVLETYVREEDHDCDAIKIGTKFFDSLCKLWTTKCAQLQTVADSRANRFQDRRRPK
jgi:hypothetical protein